MTVKYPEIEVKLVGKNGNAFAILGAVRKALQQAGVPKEERDAYMDDAMAGDYDHLLQCTMRWVTVR